ncbi:hypothetical protein BT67DRAFT_382683 [Trichocladium antarcticum]|uniref:Uncharacterized protein n=1 Tax=Trichocladium antarcticum TaxID=1450529 RepID=A0AAN6UIB9_9PEZI|nr:hypothetical protein BT67DRAFT_382683 [Trichocladium antarcticum]
MCDFIKRKYDCYHHRFIASEWCPSYTTTHKRCPPEIKHYEWQVKHRCLCGDCKAREQPPVPWEGMIKRPTGRIVYA